MNNYFYKIKNSPKIKKLELSSAVFSHALLILFEKNINKIIQNAYIFYFLYYFHEKDSIIYDNRNNDISSCCLQQIRQ